MKEVLVLFSGGKDSFLSTLLMLEKGYRVNLVTYDNGCELMCENVLTGAKRIQKKYGKDRVKIIGIKKIDAIFREMISNLYNYDINYIKNNFGNIIISQINCLSCRLSMYIMSIIISKQNNINLVIDGARRCQLFLVEQDVMIQKFKKLFNQYGLEIDFPLLDEDDDFKIKNMLLVNGFVPKMNESQCLLGMPIKNKLSDDIIEGCLNIYKKELYPKIDDMVERYKNINLTKEYK